MLTKYLRRFWWMGGLTALLMASLTLAACGSAATPAADVSTPTEESANVTPVEDTPAAEEMEPTPPVEEELEEAAEERVAETAEAEFGSETGSQNEIVAECTPADPNDDPIAGAIVYLNEYIDAGQASDTIAPVTEDDWTKGQANAPVTMIEYGDFQ